MTKHFIGKTYNLTKENMNSLIQQLDAAHDEIKRLKEAPLVLESELVVMCDIDDTLLIWSDKCFAPHEGAIEIIDPYDKAKVYLKPHARHIKLLEDYKARGYTIFLWSANGYLWAEAACDVLKLDHLVNIIMSKPLKYMDDLQAAEILGTRVYIPFTETT